MLILCTWFTSVWCLQNLFFNYRQFAMSSFDHCLRTHTEKSTGCLQKPCGFSLSGSLTGGQESRYYFPYLVIWLGSKHVPAYYLCYRLTVAYISVDMTLCRFCFLSYMTSSNTFFFFCARSKSLLIMRRLIEWVSSCIVN